MKRWMIPMCLLTALALAVWLSFSIIDSANRQQEMSRTFDRLDRMNTDCKKAREEKNGPMIRACGEAARRLLPHFPKQASP
jgi:hypothetical protein